MYLLYELILKRVCDSRNYRFILVFVKFSVFIFIFVDFIIVIILLLFLSVGVVIYGINVWNYKCIIG